ncbi:MAG: Calx-beta domain-containing protein [Chitinivibrionales bacterium]|nr:Calx-beta domain-containing protein [Chitinivibrionales bacterium]
MTAVSISFVESNSSCVETDSVHLVRVALSSASAEVVVVHYSINPDSGSQGRNFESNENSLAFMERQTTATIALRLINDTIKTGTETAVIKLFNPTNAALGILAIHRVAVQDDSGDHFSPEAIPFVYKMQQIGPRIEKLRGLTFTRPLKLGFITRAEYGAQIAASVHNDLSNDQAGYLNTEFLQMGLIDEFDTALQTTYTDHYTGFPAAYYVPGSDSLYFLTDLAFSDTAITYYVAHEMTHALQDQHLRSRAPDVPVYSYYNSDRYFAWKSLVEGDASFTGYVCLLNYLSSTIADPYTLIGNMFLNIRSNFIKYKETLDTPVYLDVQSLAPYDLGPYYVAQTYMHSSGWSGVNSKFSITGAPLSTAGIFAVDNRLVHGFDFTPLQQRLINADSALVFLDDDNAGAIILFALFYGELDSAFVSSGLGWSGDRFMFFIDAGQKYGTLIWALALTDAQKASYLFGKFDDRIRSRKLGALRPWFSALDSSVADTQTIYTYASAICTTQLIRRGSQIWWLENTGTQGAFIRGELARQQNLPALAKKSIYTPAAVPVPMLDAEAKRRALKEVLRRTFGRL